MAGWDWLARLGEDPARGGLSYARSDRMEGMDENPYKSPEARMDARPPNRQSPLLKLASFLTVGLAILSMFVAFWLSESSWLIQMVPYPWSAILPGGAVAISCLLGFVGVATMFWSLIAGLLLMCRWRRL
jgi:hypothetical protein